MVNRFIYIHCSTSAAFLNWNTLPLVFSEDTSPVSTSKSSPGCGPLDHCHVAIPQYFVRCFSITLGDSCRAYKQDLEIYKTLN